MHGVVHLEGADTLSEVDFLPYHFFAVYVVHCQTAT